MSNRIPVDSLVLRAVAQELRHALVGGMVQHIAQPAPTDLALTIRNHGANHQLLLSCDAVFARAHLTYVKRPNPPSPPVFCMICRKYIEGAFVQNIAQRDFDRVLDISVRGAGGATYSLIAELMGRHSNLILVDEAGIVLDAAKRIPGRINRFRQTLPGLPYKPPPAPEGKADPFALTTAEVSALGGTMPGEEEAQVAWLMAHFAGMSPFLATEIARRAALGSLEGAWEEIFGAAQRGEWMPVLVRNERAESVGAYPFPTVQFPPDAQHARETLNLALDHHFSLAVVRAARDALRHDLARAVERAVRAREKQRDSLQRSLEEAGRAEEYRQIGELLLANLHAIPEGADSVTVADFYTSGAPPKTIPLDPTRPPHENASLWFRRYRKAKEGAAIHREQLERVEEELSRLAFAQTRVQEARDTTELRALREELVRAGLLRGENADEEMAGPPAKRTPDFQGKKIRIYHTPEGWDIYVGENSEANDYLLTRVAAPNDWWLHARAAASAHVVIRTGNHPDAVPPQVLQRAALLAAQHSPSKHASMVPVDYTLRKYVRRPRGAPSGTALYQHEKTLYVSPKGME